MKVLVAGCGSIGRRHIGNLVESDRVESILLYTKNEHCLEGIDHKGKATTVYSLDGVEADFALVANETCRHIDTALALAERGIDLFIEKPLSHNMDKVEVLKETAEKNGVRIFVGYNLRFLGAMGYIKEQLSRKALGDLYFAKTEVGQYLPLWREERDYRDSYSVSRKHGGGVALDLSHEIDYMRYLFGEPHRWKVVKARVGSLEMEADDIFEGIYLYENNFICNVHMDCLQKDTKRNIRVVGSEGTLVCDFIGKEITVVKEDEETVLNDENMFDLDKTYRDELEHFMDVVEKGVEPAVTLKDGIAALKLIEKGVL